MAGKKINDQTLRVQSVSGDNLIPTVDPLHPTAPKVCSVDDIFLYLEAALGVNEIPNFSTTSDYAAPDLVKYDNVLYRFIAYKTAGPWDSSKVVQTSIFEELQAMRDGDNETVNVTVSSTDGNLTVSGLEVAITYNGATQVGTTDSNGNVSFSVAKGVKYQLSMSDQTGYYHIPDKNFMASYNERYVAFSFIPLASTISNVENVNVCMTVGTTQGTGIFTEAVGEKIQYIIEGDSEIHEATIQSNGWAFFTVPIGSEYRIKFPRVSGYSKPEDIVYTASLTNRYVLSYAAWYIGDDEIQILCDDGQEYSIETYNSMTTRPTGLFIHVNSQQLRNASSGLANNQGCDFYIDVNIQTSSLQFLNSNVLIAGLAQVTSSNSGNSNDCHYDFTGMKNTQTVLAFVQNNGYTCAAATWAAGQSVTVGSRTLQGFIGAFGQLWAIKTGLTSINAALALTSGKVLNVNSSYLWSSTQCNNLNMWFMFGGNSYNDGNKNSRYTVLPLFA